MANKSNIRSFRYSDEIACILNQQPGDSLNAKFEYLVESCYCEIERKQEELARIERQIEQRRQVLQTIARLISSGWIQTVGKLMMLWMVMKMI